MQGDVDYICNWLGNKTLASKYIAGVGFRAWGPLASFSRLALLGAEKTLMVSFRVRRAVSLSWFKTRLTLALPTA